MMAKVGSKSVRVEMGPIHVHNVQQLRVINASIFPVPYHEKFYRDVQNAGEWARLGKDRTVACATT